MADGAACEDPKRDTNIQASGMKMSDMTPDDRYLLQRVCRGQMKVKLLADIAADMEVCQMEGWDKMEYINELQEILNSFRK